MTVVQSIKDTKSYKLSKMALEDPLTPHTETKRRNLLFTACFSIVLVAYNLKVNQIPWVTFENTEKSLPVLQGALAVALFYTFIVFTLHALIDLKRWYFTADNIYLDSYLDSSIKTRNLVHALTQWLDNPLPDDPTRRAAVEDLLSKAKAHFSDVGVAVSTIKSAHLQLTITTWIRIVLVDLGVPLFLGIFATVKIGPALIPFLAVVFG